MYRARHHSAQYFRRLSLSKPLKHVTLSPPRARVLLQAHTAVEILRSPGWQLLMPGDTTASGWTLPVREGHFAQTFARRRDEENNQVNQSATTVLDSRDTTYYL